MKWYPITEPELDSLATLDSGLAVMLSIASACLGFYISVQQSLDFAVDVPAATVARWETWQSASTVAGLLALVGVVTFGWKRNRLLDRIKTQTNHDN